MSHNEYKQLIYLSLYSELNEELQSQLKSHIESCKECRTELEQQKNLLTLLAKNKKLEADESLLKEARLQLRGALRNERSIDKKFSFYTDKIFRLIATPSRFAFSSALLLLVGMLIGSIFFGKGETKIISGTPNDEQLTALPEDVNIRNIQFIDSDPSDGEVEFTFEAVRPVYMKGKVNDEQIRSVLTYAMLNEQNPGSRLNSINAMETGEQGSFDKDVKDALITVVMTDNNPGVRREALQLMKKLNYDEQIKQAYLYIILNDTSSGLRINALNALIDAAKQGHSLNQKDKELFVQKIRYDSNNYIRLKSKTLLEEYR